MDIEDILQRVLKLGAEYCDVRFESSARTVVEVKDAELKKAYSGMERGASVRVLYNGSWGFCSANNLSDKTLKSLFESAFKLAKASSVKVEEKIRLADVPVAKAHIIWHAKKAPLDISIEEKHKLLSEVSAGVREVKGILTATVSYSDGTIKKEFFSSEGSEIQTELTRTLLQINLTAKNTALLGYRTRIGGTAGLEIFALQNPVERGVQAAKTVVRLLHAEKAPSGRFPVIVDNELAGVFVHEALGHACEADTVIAGESILENKRGTAVGSENVTVYDDSTIKSAFGSFPYDDEGVKGRRKILIKSGILRDFILSRETAYKLGMEPNGGARAESYAVRPLVRMSNTVIEKGEHSFEELLENIKFGIYAKGTRGGQVDTAKGSFQFSAQEAYLIENGEVTKPLRDVSLAGATVEILKSIDAVGRDYRLGEPGFCGKGQLVPVGDGGPHVRIKKATVGGK